MKKLIIALTLCHMLFFVASCGPEMDAPFADYPSTENPSDEDKPSDDKPTTGDEPTDPQPPTEEPEVIPPAAEVMHDAIYTENGRKLGIYFHTISASKKKVVSAAGGILKWATSNSTWGISGNKTEYDYVHAVITSSNAYKANSKDFPAVNFCEQMRKDYGGNWHLPSVDELKLLYDVYVSEAESFDATLEYMGGTGLLEGSNIYWSCAQNSGGNVQHLNMSTKAAGNAAQTDTRHVRCVRDVDNSLKSTVTYPNEGAAKVKTLQTTSGWTTTKIADGITYYLFSGTDDVSGAKQNVNVLEVDLNNEKYQINFDWAVPSDKLSATAVRNGAIAGINGTFELSSVYIRVNAYNRSLVDLDLSVSDEYDRYCWKHSGAIVGNGLRKIGIVNAAPGQESTKAGGDAAIAFYNKLPENYIFSSGPVLIDNYKLLGETFVTSNLTSSDLSKLGGDDYRRHQGERHPRTAVALTEDNDLLLIVVDGRNTNAAGMTAKELTKFLKKHLNPKWALNMDGGGSSAMYVKGKGGASNNIVNYPSDNEKWDHDGERTYRTTILVCPVTK